MSLCGEHATWRTDAERRADIVYSYSALRDRTRALWVWHELSAPLSALDGPHTCAMSARMMAWLQNSTQHTSPRHTHGSARAHPRVAHKTEAPHSTAEAVLHMTAHRQQRVWQVATHIHTRVG
uniref:Uncharacterized protein n=1 Tax=Haptolina ericina TaxID=156174 RepID=A0A7S3C105_9EUKA